MHPLHYQGRLSRSGHRLLDIFVNPTSACFTPENSLVGAIERPLGPRRRICHVQGADMSYPVRSGRGALLSAESPRGGGGALSSAGRGQLAAFPRDCRELASRRPYIRWRLTSLVLYTNQQVDPGSGWWYAALRFLSCHRNPPPVVPPVSSRWISSELSLSRGPPGWGA